MNMSDCKDPAWCNITQDGIRNRDPRCHLAPKSKRRSRPRRRCRYRACDSGRLPIRIPETCTGPSQCSKRQERPPRVAFMTGLTRDTARCRLLQGDHRSLSPRTPVSRGESSRGKSPQVQKVEGSPLHRGELTLKIIIAARAETTLRGEHYSRRYN